MNHLKPALISTDKIEIYPYLEKGSRGSPVSYNVTAPIARAFEFLIQNLVQFLYFEELKPINELDFNINLEKYYETNKTR